MKRAAVLGCLVVLVAIVRLSNAPSVSAQTPEQLRTVEGHVVNGTPGAGGSSGLTVVFHRQNVGAYNRLDTTTDGQGRFRFDGLPYDPETLYGVTVGYQGAVYGTDLDLSAGSPPPLSLMVYEASDADSVLSVSSASILFAQVDAASQTVWALEIVKLENGTDTTYVPGPEPMRLLRFGLPLGANGLQVDTALLRADVLQVDRGFALTANVPPGEHEVMFSYQFPYSGTESVISRSLPYGAESLRVLTPLEVAEISAAKLTGPNSVDIGSRSYRLLEGRDLPRGSKIALRLSSLPQPSFSQRLAEEIKEVRWEYAAPGTLAVIMASAVAFALWRRSALGRYDAEGEPGRVGPDPGRQRLVHQIAELDARFAEGALDESGYQRRRDVLARRLAAKSVARLARPK